MNPTNPPKRPKPAFHVSSLHVSPLGNDVSVRMSFFGIGQYFDAQTLADQQGWEIDISKSRAGSEMSLVVKDSTVTKVVDRMHEIGLSSAGNRCQIPAPSKTFD